MLGLLESEEEMVSHSLEQHLKELGIFLEKKPSVSSRIDPYKIAFNDPRDPITGEVPF
jgi:hypothetical protein